MWSYPNTHSDYVAVANQTGAKQGATTTYDPYGNTTTGAVPDNSAGQMDYGWLGQPQRPTEQQTSLQPTMEMGARQYSPRLGRFIEQDPIEGGSANDYDYVGGDPVNRLDVTGTICWSCAARRVGNLVRHPVSTIGSYTVARLSRGKCRGYQGMNVCTGVKGPAGWFIRSVLKKDAITLGGTIVSSRDQLSGTLLAHEISHGSQYALRGSAFYPLYAAGSALQLATRGSVCNPLERYANHGRAHGCG